MAHRYYTDTATLYFVNFNSTGTKPFLVVWNKDENKDMNFVIRSMAEQHIGSQMANVRR